jgi:hypothetical protein
MSEDHSVVYPPEGGAAETARMLLDLADHPGQVLTANGGAAFVVPTELAEAYMDLVSPPRGKRARKTTDNKEG